MKKAEEPCSHTPSKAIIESVPIPSEKQDSKALNILAQKGTGRDIPTIALQRGSVRIS